jgi:hypothetical protein
MRSIKFASQEEALAVCERVFESASLSGAFVVGTSAYAIPEKEELWTVPVLAGFERFFSAEELGLADIFSDEKKGRVIIDRLIARLKEEAMTVSDSSTYLNKLATVLVMLQAGNLPAAQDRTIGLSLTQVYTAQRRDWLVQEIENQIRL